ncbi:hypothetical protein D3C87_1912130 [compost metagenome]
MPGLASPPTISEVRIPLNPDEYAYIPADRYTVRPNHKSPGPQKHNREAYQSYPGSCGPDGAGNRRRLVRREARNN